ncbi:hypothetical protein KW458_04835 [Vibrio fluvialis]|nr:hypothetical protein [Vibrio fluvialis]
MYHKSSVCAAITLYHPSSSELERVFYYTKVFDKVFVIDNTPDDNDMSDIISHPKIQLLSRGVNLGLAKALNLACETAFDLNFDFCCLLDQDSEFNTDSIGIILNIISQVNIDDIAIVSPNINYEHEDGIDSIRTPQLDDVDWVITSGSFVNLKIHKLLKGFDEAYFIDRLEMDYCYRAKNKGYRIVICLDSIMRQSLGEPCRAYGCNFYQHSPLRNYYQFRNRIYYYRYKSKENIYFRFLKMGILSFKHILKVIFIEEKKIKKICYISRAIKDSFKGAYGEYGKG